MIQLSLVKSVKASTSIYGKHNFLNVSVTIKETLGQISVLFSQESDLFIYFSMPFDWNGWN